MRVIEMKKTMKDYLEKDHFDVIIDVRDEDEFNEGHVAGAINIPLSEIHTYEENKDKHIAIYCFSGRRAGLAYDILQKHGYQDITNIGGVSDGSVSLIHE